jgi:hypothetical protein
MKSLPGITNVIDVDGIAVTIHLLRPHQTLAEYCVDGGIIFLRVLPITMPVSDTDCL